MRGQPRSEQGSSVACSSCAAELCVAGGLVCAPPPAFCHPLLWLTTWRRCLLWRCAGLCVAGDRRRVVDDDERDERRRSRCSPSTPPPLTTHSTVAPTPRTPVAPVPPTPARHSRSGLSGVQCADSAVLVAQAPLPGPAVSTDRSVQRERNRETAAGAEGDRRASRRRGSQPGAAAGR